MLGAPESGHSFGIFTRARQLVEQRLRSAVSNPSVNQAMTTGGVSLDDVVRPYEAKRLAVLVVNGSATVEFRCGAPP
jgi:hypothetical protein